MLLQYIDELSVSAFCVRVSSYTASRQRSLEAILVLIMKAHTFYAMHTSLVLVFEDWGETESAWYTGH
jgi:hypothetical protein